MRKLARWLGPGALLVAALMLAPPVGAAASPFVEVVEPKPPPTRDLALTISPLRLYYRDGGSTVSMLELTAEHRLTDQVSLALVLGGGRWRDPPTLVRPAVSSWLWEVGVQGRYYVAGDFRHGLQLGAEALVITASAMRASATTWGGSAGVFGGYKYTSSVGFTVDAQLGIQQVVVLGRATAAGGLESEKPTKVAPLLNLNLGWSF